jgi:hypothetical protein
LVSLWTDTRELLTYPRPEANQHILDQRLTNRLAPESYQKILLASDLRYVGNSLAPVCWLASDLRYVGNSLVSVCWLASDLRSVVNSLVD